MFANNPFATLTDVLPANAMQIYVVLMALAVFLGTLYDIIHKGSAKYFFQNWRKSRDRGRRRLRSGEIVSLAIKAGAVDVLTSGEFCNVRRRIAHLLTMYGFLLYVITTAVMVFNYPSPATPAPAILPLLWWIGGLMICVGGYWFWFFIRVDVAAEGHSPLRFVRADLFVVSLVASATLALIWAYLQSTSNSWTTVFFGLYILATTVLFGSVAWSKFAHMFFKPAAALEKRVSNANGTRSNLPGPANRPEQFGTARRHTGNY